MKYLSFVTDPEIDCLFPEKRLAKVVITLHEDTVLQSELYAGPVETSHNVDLGWITKKFNHIAQQQ